MTQEEQILVLMGATATGKTKLGVELAQQLGGEIISVDSALVYQGMDIGTAKPTEGEKGGIPHHLIDILDPRDSYSVGQFVADANRIIRDVWGRGRLPIFVGGTMLYFNGLLNGIAELPPADEVVRASLDEQAAALGWQAMHDRLAEIDPESAVRIHPNDPQRIQRALEVYELTGKSLSWHFLQAKERSAYFTVNSLILEWADRSDLHRKVAERFDQMLSAGLVAEVTCLRARGDLHIDLPSMRTVGYKQVWEYLQGDVGYAKMRDKGIVATRQLAKRQLTWLRKYGDVSRYSPQDADLVKNILRDFKLGKLLKAT